MPSRRFATASAVTQPRLSQPGAFERAAEAAAASRSPARSRCPSRGWRTARRPPASKAGGAHPAASAGPRTGHSRSVHGACAAGPKCAVFDCHRQPGERRDRQTRPGEPSWALRLGRCSVAGGCRSRRVAVFGLAVGSGAPNGRPGRERFARAVAGVPGGLRASAGRRPFRAAARPAALRCPSLGSTGAFPPPGPCAPAWTDCWRGRPQGPLARHQRRALARSRSSSASVCRAASLMNSSPSGPCSFQPIGSSTPISRRNRALRRASISGGTADP